MPIAFTAERHVAVAHLPPQPRRLGSVFDLSSDGRVAAARGPYRVDAWDRLRLVAVIGGAPAPGRG
jgi:hypothetical protein